MYKIQQDGEILYVNSLSGHEKAAVLDANAEEPSAVSETARINGMSKAELFALAVETAKQQIIDDMAANGVISLDAASAMKSATLD